MKRLIAAIDRAEGLIVLLAALAQADGAEWLREPDSGDWNSAPNWTPGGPPNGPGARHGDFRPSHTPLNVFISAQYRR